MFSLDKGILKCQFNLLFGKPPYRPQSWKIIFGYLPTNASRRQHTLQRKRAEYKDAIGQHYYIDDNSRTIQEQEVLRQVLVDVPRTAPDVQLFRDERIKKLLSRILYIWAMRHPASSYVQGINDLAMPLIITFLTEKTSAGAENNDDISDIDYDEVLDGRIMESVSDERLDEVSYLFLLGRWISACDCVYLIQCFMSPPVFGCQRNAKPTEHNKLDLP